MNVYLLDIDTLSLFLQGEVTAVSAVIAHLFLSDAVAISIATVQEVWNG